MIGVTSPKTHLIVNKGSLCSHNVHQSKQNLQYYTYKSYTTGAQRKAQKGKDT